MKLFILGGFAPSLILFRGHLLAELSRRGHRVVAAAAGGTPELERALARIDVEYHELPLRRAGMNPLADARFFGTLVHLLRRERPELLFCYTIKPVIYGSLAGRAAGVPRVASLITGLGYGFLSQDKLARRALRTGIERLYRLALGQSEVVLFQNPDDQREFLDRGLLSSSKRTAIISGSGVDIDHHAAAPPVTSPLTFLFIGRLLREKGVIELVEAAREIRHARPDVRVKLVAPDDPNPAAVPREVVDTWRREGVIDHVDTWQDDVRPFLRAASVYVLPSYREGTPRTVLEAMATGRPIITTDVPGCRETVVDGDNGFLVPVRDSAALARAMRRFIDDPSLIATMGARSRAIAEAKYDVRKVTQQILHALHL